VFGDLFAGWSFAFAGRIASFLVPYYCSISVHVPLYSVAGRHLSSINTMVCATLSLLDSSESIHSPHVPAVKSMGRNGMRCQPSLTPEAD